MLGRYLAASAALVLLSSTLACGDEVVQQAPDDDGSGAGGIGGTGPGAVGTGGVTPGPQAIETLTAPTETTVTLELAEDAGEAALLLESWTIDSAYGPVAVEGVTVGPDGRTVELTTSTQKLGVTYTLSYAAGDETLDGDFLAADTARFWYADLGSPNFEQVEIVATRLEVGPRSVIYVQEGESMSNAAAIADHFEQDVYPTETAMFTEAPDRDENGRIVLLGVDGKGSFGGYFNPIDTLDDEMTFQQWGYHSNEKEMLYLNTENGFVQAADVVVPHEMSHLLYQELHPSLFEDWPYHNEGLAECAVNAVNGAHGYALDVYIADPLGDLANGISLVQWEYGNYSQYVQAYVFWSYVAGQLDGVGSYTDLMHQNGHPNSMQGYLQQQLGKTFSEAQLSALAATWAQHPSGEHSFNGVLSFPGKPKIASSASLALSPFTGVFTVPGPTTVDYPGTQGPDIVYAGIDGAGNVDLTAPFEVGGGVLVALNTAFEIDAPATQPIGLIPNQPPAAPQADTEALARSRAWLHPPPFNPEHLERMHAWRALTR